MQDCPFLFDLLIRDVRECDGLFQITGEYVAVELYRPGLTLMSQRLPLATLDIAI